ncbi:MAG: ATP-binding protein [Bacteroidota bacterium]
MLQQVKPRAIGLMVLLLAIFSSLQAQIPQFSNFEIQKGYRIADISNIVQDAAGNIWFGCSEGLFRYDGVTFTNFNTNNREYYIPTNSIKKIRVDKEEGYLILYNNDSEVYEVDPINKQHRQVKLEEPDGGPGIRWIMDVHLDGKGGLWAARIEFPKDHLYYKLSVYHTSKRDSFRLVKELESKKLFFTNFSSVNEGHLYVNFEELVLEFAPDGQIINQYPFPRGKPGGHFWDESQTLWMMSNMLAKDEQGRDFGRGIFYMEKGEQTFREFEIKDTSLLAENNKLYVDKDRVIAYTSHFSIIDRSSREGNEYSQEILGLDNLGLQDKLGVKEVFKDLSGVYWLGGRILKKLEFDLVEHILQGGTPFCKNWNCAVREILEDEKGNIIFGTSHRVLQYNPQTTIVDTFECNQQLDVWDNWGLTLQPPFLYVDNRRVNLEDCTFNFLIDGKRLPTFNALDRAGNLWLGGERSVVSIYDVEKDTLVRLDALKEMLKGKAIHIRSILPRKKGPGTWVLTSNNGLYLLDREEGLLAQYTYDPTNENSVPSPQLYDVYESEVGNLWIGSSGGLSKLEIATNTFTHYTTEDGLPTSKVYSILPESDQGLWLGTAYGISFLDFSSQTFFNFSTEHGLGNTEYNTHAAYQSKAGKIYFGGLDGIDAFYPEAFLEPNISRSMPLIITQFNRFDQELEQIKSSDLHQLDRITLAPANKYFELYFKLADYRRNAENLYSYKMEGYDEDWSPPGKQNFLRYENLPAGTYTLRVKAAITPTTWNERALNITVVKQQYWYKTTIAYACYILTCLGLIYGLYQFLLNQRLKAQETQQLKEMDALKTKLYTNITHEFRTPLTVIQGMADQIKDDVEAKTLIQRNSKNLLRLVDQLLDMSKLESQKMRLHLTSTNIVAFLQYLIQSFDSYGATKNISLTFHTEVPEVIMAIDVDKMQHVIANLLSNAIKFTQEGGAIALSVSKSKDQPVLQIKIEDNGIGIAEADLPHIFDRFYRVDDTHTQVGTGIGLALTKELLELMGGTITVASEPMQGTSFTIALPIQNEKEQAAIELVNADRSTSVAPILLEAQGPIKEPLRSPAQSDLPLLLIIEDNPDVVTYIITCLKDQYQIQTAYDGQEGIEKALNSIPDIIISDVMMPKKDGYEVTQLLKNDTRTSHIPIILLTAKADTDSKMIGLKRGADAYLTKPFHKQELLIRLEQLIALRRKMQERYASATPPPPSAEPSLQVEDAFLKQIRELIQQHLSDVEFSVPDLCLAIGMSQPQLYRKIKALTNRSIAAYLRSIRLQEGKVLLATTNHTIAEIAYQVGFNDPKYFSKTFLQEFGVLPSTFR